MSLRNIAIGLVGGLVTALMVAGYLSMTTDLGAKPRLGISLLTFVIVAWVVGRSPRNDTDDGKAMVRYGQSEYQWVENNAIEHDVDDVDADVEPERPPGRTCPGCGTVNHGPYSSCYSCRSPLNDVSG